VAFNTEHWKSEDSETRENAALYTWRKVQLRRKVFFLLEI